MSFEKVQSLLNKYNRELDDADARSSYYDLVTDNTNEELAYELNKLFENLQFTASEMWIGSREIKTMNITLDEIKSLSNEITVTKKNGYYSDELVKETLSLYQKLSLKEKKPRSRLEEHVYNSLAKELLCYKVGHKLVQEYKKQDN